MRTETGEVLTAQDFVQVAPNARVEKGVLEVIDWIRDYDPNLDVMYLNPDRLDTSPFDAPWIIVEHCFDGKTRLVFSCWDMNESVKQRIIAADMSLRDLNAAIEKNNQAVREALKKSSQEKMAEAGDILTHAMKAPTTYTFHNHEGELIKLEDDKGVVRRDGKDPDEYARRRDQES